MKHKGCSRELILYEIRNTIGNPFTHIFGIAFPILMSVLLSAAFRSQIPEEMRAETTTEMMITMSMVIPMATILIGYSANYSQELEKEAPMRMILFGFKESSIMAAKIIAQFVFMTAALLIFAVAEVLLLDILVPSVWPVVSLVLCLYVLGAIFFVLAHSIAIIFNKFGPTYAMTMLLYFGIMMLCGMMGVRPDQLPKGVKAIADTLPMTYISEGFVEFWKGNSYNFVPMIQAFLFLGAVSGILLFAALYKNRRVLR